MDNALINKGIQEKGDGSVSPAGAGAQRVSQLEASRASRTCPLGAPLTLLASPYERRRDRGGKTRAVSSTYGV